MLTTKSLLDLATQRHGLSDYRLSQILGVSSSRVCNYRNGRSRPDETMCRELAKLADVDPDYAVVCIQAERAVNEESRSVWEHIAGRLQAAGKVTAVVAIATLLSQHGDANALALQKGGATVTNCATLYIM